MNVKSAVFKSKEPGTHQQIS